MSNDRQFGLYVADQGDGTFLVSVETVTKDNRFLFCVESDARFPLNSWHHLVYSSLHGSGTCHLYVHGKPQRMHVRRFGGATDFFFSDLMQGGDDLQIGAKSDSHMAQHGPSFQGAMRDLMIFNQVLSQRQVAAFVAAGRGGDLARYARTSSLVAGYHLDEGWGTTVHDFSGHGNDGTLHGGATWVPGRVPHAGPVQWSESRGGNGHWYEVVSVPGGITWTDAKQAAQDKGGYLATITSAEENAFVYSLVDDDRFWKLVGNNDDGPWLGGAYDRKGGDWRWVTGEPWDYTNWYPGQPDHQQVPPDRLYPQDSLHFYGGDYKRTPMWDDDWHETATGSVAYVVEWNSRPWLRHDHAMQFDGTRYATVPQSTKFTSGDFTISLWFNPRHFNLTSFHKAQFLFMRAFAYRDQQGDIGLKISVKSGQLDFQARTANEEWLFGWDEPESHLRSPFQFDQWNHVVVMRRGDTYTMWMNGKHIGSEQSSADISDSDNTNPFIVGGSTSEGGVGEMFQGALDEFRIFRRCLSDKEITDLYNGCGGGEGTVTISGWTDAGRSLHSGRSHGNRPADEAKHAAPAPLAFGPAMSREFTTADCDDQGLAFLSMTTGKLFKPPFRLTVHPKQKADMVSLTPEQEQWIKANDIDVLYHLGSDAWQKKLFDFQMYLVGRQGDWERVTPESVVATFERGDTVGLVGGYVPGFAHGNYGPGWSLCEGFRTRSGVMGVLQQEDFERDSLRGTRIRYRLVRGAVLPAPARINPADDR